MTIGSVHNSSDPCPYRAVNHAIKNESVGYLHFPCVCFLFFRVLTLKKSNQLQHRLLSKIERLRGESIAQIR